MEPAIAVEDLSIGYGVRPVLEGIRFSIPPGGVFAILGPSGSGKSTLLKALVGRLPPLAGSVRVLGRELGPETDVDELNGVRRRIGMLFQTGGLLGSLTVYENVALPIEEFTDLPSELVTELVRLKLAQVDLSEHVARMPAELSGGMAKRVGLARAMALDPEILLCDEPTGGLDPATSRTIDRLLLDLNESLGITLVVVTHDLGTVENLAGSCILIDAETRGIVAAGTSDAIRREAHPRVRDFFQRSIDRPADGEGKP